ncbi:uncharacterized protein MYCFIDRAFT_200295 [Pseudocercospora fijiensis CIRAD86]|uniref:DUF7730 domain-containing protein n=1 Tax=Pseudocercospora fijiensis (strain CIRAD86) TaxID=383855 RepID=M3A0H7_PSEFD|nr:uncharacterized protein MYCFIDRAFT_200295 [Pseudocercospora fijiensis CIRAD86]EME77911.1 hypothetical protein MYCFIDRAFT_200295 [Pseudocercospora fijiensis CIRAD86]
MSCNTKQSPFPFLSLPPELRDQIYTALLSAQHSIDIFRYQKRFTCTKSSDSNDENPEGVHIPVSILRICKQIHAEATPVLYSSNKFVFTFPSVLTGFLEGTRAARWMMDVAINYPGNRVEILGSLKVLEMGVVRLERLELGGAIGNCLLLRRLRRSWWSCATFCCQVHRLHSSSVRTALQYSGRRMRTITSMMDREQKHDIITMGNTLSTPRNSTVQTEKAPVGFFDLSPELRNKIYRHALVLPESIQLDRAYDNEKGTLFVIDDYQAKQLSLPLLRTCRQMHQEATSIFYGENIFQFHHASWMTIFLPKQIKHSIQHLRYVEIINLNDDLRTITRYLSPAKNLITLALPYDMVEDLFLVEEDDEEDEEIEIDLDDSEEDDDREIDLDQESLTPIAFHIAEQLEPFAQALFETQKDDLKVLSVFKFRYWDLLSTSLYQTQPALALQAAVRECLQSMLSENDDGPACCTEV